MRRTKPVKRPVSGDARYGNPRLQGVINRLMRSGKKSLANAIVYDAFELIEARTKKQPEDVFEQALKNVSPMLEVKPRRVGGATYQVPVEVAPERRYSLAVRWILGAARDRSGKSMAEKLAGELIDASNGAGAAIRRREESHRMAEANRAFAHYRW